MRWKRLANFQAWLTGIGFIILMAGLHWGAHLGVPRRMQSIRFPGADAPVPNWLSSMNLLGIGGFLAATGVLLFVVIALWALLSGSKRAPEMVAELKDLRPASERA